MRDEVGDPLHLCIMLLSHWFRTCYLETEDRRVPPSSTSPMSAYPLGYMGVTGDRIWPSAPSLCVKPGKLANVAVRSVT